MVSDLTPAAIEKVHNSYKKGITNTSIYGKEFIVWTGNRVNVNCNKVVQNATGINRLDDIDGA